MCKCVLFNFFYPIQNKSLQPSQSEVQPSCEPSHLSMPFGTGQRGFVNVLQVVASTTNQTCWIMGIISSNSFMIKQFTHLFTCGMLDDFGHALLGLHKLGCEKKHICGVNGKGGQIGTLDPIIPITSVQLEFSCA